LVNLGIRSSIKSLSLTKQIIKEALKG